MAITTIHLSSLDGNNGFRLDGVAENDFSGASVSNAGDVNGDGFDDVIVGAFGADPNGSFSGSSYVVFGKAAGFAATMDLSSLDGSNGFRLDGVAAEDRSGIAVSSGDVNGDGFDDVIVGAHHADPRGASYVVFGKIAGFAATLDLSSLDGSNGFRMNGEAAGNILGSSVSNAGDVNGDGFDDVIVGDLLSGSSYVVFGKATGFGARLDLSSLGGSNGFRLNGTSSISSVSSAGDVNGDGFDDVIVGDYNAGPRGDDSGSSYVVFGKASGFAATMDLSSLDGSNGFRLDGITEDDYAGFSVSGAGDMNGDGFADVIVGAPFAGTDGNESGASYVVFGKASGFAATQNLSSLDGSNGFRVDGVVMNDQSGVSSAGDVNGDGFADVLVGKNSGSDVVIFGKASGFDAALDLSSLDGNSGFRLDGTEVSTVSSAGDVNGDGFDDVIVGDYFADPNGLGFGTGSSYVVFGRSNFGSGNVIEGTSGDDSLKGTSAAEIFEAGDGNDSMTGRGGADVFHGDAGNDNIRVADLGFASVDGGAGNDVLHLDGSGLDMNLADFEDKISGIETICIYGRGDNTLTLTAADLLNLSDTTNTLKVHGNAGDRIVLDGDWVDGGSRGFYHMYTQDDVVLLVGMNLATDFA